MSGQIAQRLIDKYNDYSQQAWDKYNALPPRVKVVFWFFTTVQCLVGAITIYLGPARIFEALAEYARDLREMPLGWLVIIVGIMVSGVPPIISLYGMLVTICGFAYHESVVKGWLVATSGCLIGSASSFLICRLFIAQFRPFLDQSRHFNALARVIDEKGMPLIALVRFAPISFAYSNLLFASIPSVDLPRFLLGTVAITPKLFLHVFMGNRMYQLADPSERQKLDRTGKILNGVSIAVGALVGSGVGFYVWKMTVKYVNAVELRDDDALEEGLLSGRSSADLRRSREFARDDTTPTAATGAAAEEMSLDEIDRELAAQGVDKQGDDQWGDQFSDFDETEQQEQQQQEGTGQHQGKKAGSSRSSDQPFL